MREEASATTNTPLFFQILQRLTADTEPGAEPKGGAPTSPQLPKAEAWCLPLLVIGNRMDDAFNSPKARVHGHPARGAGDGWG